MAGKSVSMYANIFQENMLKASTASGFDMVATGAAVGGITGGAQGSFSDYGSFLGGATKGAITGGIIGTGGKYATSKYAKGYKDAFKPFVNSGSDSYSKFGDTMNKLPTNKQNDMMMDMYTPNFGNFKSKLDESDSWFNTKDSTAYDMYNNAKKYYKDNR